MYPSLVHSFSNCFLFLAGQEIRDRFSGAVEAFARRNASGSGHHADRQKSLDDAGGSSKEAVSYFECTFFYRNCPASRYHVKQLQYCIVEALKKKKLRRTEFLSLSNLRHFKYHCLYYRVQMTKASSKIISNNIFPAFFCIHERAS